MRQQTGWWHAGVRGSTKQTAAVLVPARARCRRFAAGCGAGAGKSWDRVWQAARAVEQLRGWTRAVGAARRTQRKAFCKKHKPKIRRCQSSRTSQRLWCHQRRRNTRFTHEKLVTNFMLQNRAGTLVRSVNCKNESFSARSSHAVFP